jgi:two-component system cell cycle response regulator
MTARILVVDDVPSNARLLEALLAEEYYEVKSIQDSRETLRVANDWQPDVLLLDVMMPGLDGYAVCRLIKGTRATAHIPVVMVTALREPPDRLQALACGADEFLSKPLEKEILLARLRGIIRLKRLLDEWRSRGASTAALGLNSRDPTRDLQQATFQGVNVLIVDDLSFRARRLANLLVPDGISAQSVETEPDAMRAIEATDFDLIVVSLSLIATAPLRLVAKLRASNMTRDTPLLVICEPDQRSLLISALDLGASDCILLPLDESEFLLRTGNHIRRKLYQDRLRTDFDNALQMAIIDPLTGLHNRRYLEINLEALYAEPAKREFAVLMIDVDHFKSINDRHGHQTGDAVLQTVADVLRRNLRESDLIARYGGEEFVVVLRASDEPRAVELGERLRGAIAQIPRAPDPRVTISVGVAMSRYAGSAEALIERADHAMYQAKRAGRDRVVQYVETLP